MAFMIDLKGGPRLKSIPIDRISPNPDQPRRIFDETGLKELADSIAQLGVITPLTVRRAGEGYLLIAGERRLRASRLAGLEAVPCYIIEADDKSSALMALVENLQRRDLDPFEEAEGLRRLIEEHGMTQQQAAGRIGKTQAAVANKLRLLKLYPSTVAILRENRLSERHGRALLAISDEELQNTAARNMAKKGMTVAAAEKYISSLIQKKPDKPSPVRKILLRDIRFFLNSVDHAIASVRAAGIPADCTTERREDGTIAMTIIITDPKRRAADPASGM